MSDFVLNVRAAGGSDNYTQIVKVSNASEIGTNQVADQAALPTPTLALQGQIFHAIAENTYHTVNTAFDGYDLAVKPLGGASETIQVNWAFDDTDTAATDPAYKKFKFNNATPASVTAIYVSDTSNSGIDVSTIFAGLESGDKLYIQQIDAFGQNILFNVTGITDNTGWFTITVTVDDSTGAPFGDTKDCAFDFDWVSNVSDGAISVSIKDHAVTTAASWKTAETNIIANPRKFKNIFRIDRDITLVQGDESTGKVEGEIWFIAKTTVETTRLKITDNKYRMVLKDAQIKWDGIDYLMDAADNDVFFEGDAGKSQVYQISNCDISRNADLAFIRTIDDSYGNITFDKVTGTDTSTSFGKVHLKQNSVGTQKAIIDLNIKNGCDFSGLLASADGTVGELNVYVSGSVIKNNGNGVWNATNGAVIKVFYTPDSKVDETLVAGSSAVTFTEIFKIPHAQIDLKNNFIATTDPGTSNDNTEGYIVGSTWINVTLDKVFQAVDVSTGAAVWKNLSAASQTGAEIKTLYEAEANAYTDTKDTKLTSIETDAKDDQTGAEIKTAYEAEANAYTDTKNTKLTGIETAAKDDQTDAEIETAYNAQVAAMSQATAEAGTSTDIERVTAERIKQAILALAPSVSADPWKTVASSKYTATAASSSTITMSDTTDFFLGGGVEYTDASGTFYGVVTAITASLLTIAGAPLDVGDDITLLRTAPATQVIIFGPNVPGTYGDGVETDLLRDDANNPFRWKLGKAFLVAFEASHGTVDTGTEPKLNVEINNAAVSTNDTNLGLQLGAANTFVKNSAVAISSANYDINYDEELELSCTAAGGTGDAADLTAILTFVLER